MSEAGFTLLEVLVSLGILSILVGVVSVSVIGLVRVNSDTRVKVKSDIAVQNVAEQIKASWSVPANYNRHCVDNFGLPAGFTARTTAYNLKLNLESGASAPSNLQKVDESMEAVNIVNCAPDLAVDSYIPPLRRVAVEGEHQGQKMTIYVDILSPEAVTE